MARLRRAFARLQAKGSFCVDDCADTLELLQCFFGDEQTVVTAQDFNSARQIIETQWFELIILDTRLPDGSVIDLMKMIWTRSPNTPVLFLSADARPNVLREALAAGARGYLVSARGFRGSAGTGGQLLRQAQDRSLEAVWEEYYIVQEHLRARFEAAADAASAAAAKWERARAHAREVFIGHGGTPKHFECLWPLVLEHASQTPS